jgi:hypothetical protein
MIDTKYWRELAKPCVPEVKPFRATHLNAAYLSPAIFMKLTGQAVVDFCDDIDSKQAEIARLRGVIQPMYDEFAKSAAPVNPMAAIHEMWLADQKVTFDADLVGDLFAALAEGNGQEGGV